MVVFSTGGDTGLVLIQNDKEAGGLGLRIHSLSILFLTGDVGSHTTQRSLERLVDREGQKRGELSPSCLPQEESLNSFSI